MVNDVDGIPGVVVNAVGRGPWCSGAEVNAVGRGSWCSG